MFMRMLRMEADDENGGGSAALARDDLAPVRGDAEGKRREEQRQCERAPVRVLAGDGDDDGAGDRDPRDARGAGEAAQAGAISRCE
jgi:hypothetical protein